MADVEIDYDFLTQQALKRVVRDVLGMTEELGAAPGDHHFYIEFQTQGDGVVVPDHLIAQYPVRMTIVLQHQFDDLIVNDDEFSVSLWFKGQQARLTVPFAAITSFADPSVQFGLRFEPPPANAEPPAPIRKAETPAAPATPKEAAAIVQLDAFRKK